MTYFLPVLGIVALALFVLVIGSVTYLLLGIAIGICFDVLVVATIEKREREMGDRGRWRVGL